MAENKLEIIIGVDNKGATAGIKQVDASLKTLPKSVAAAGSSLNKLGKETGSATLALGNLGRVAQDAPFGFIGISNNLNPLLESFQRLKAESGSTGGALKALGGSLLGAGGIGLALSAVTAAITFAQMGFRAWGGSAKKAASEVKDALAEAASGVAKDLVQLQSYVSFAQDVTKSYGERKKAIDALREAYPQYLKGISDEAILTGKATDAINASIDALLRKATLSLLKDEIAAVVAESAKQILAIEKGKIATQQAANAEKNRAEKIRNSRKVFDEQAAAALQTGRAITEVSGAYQKLELASERAFANKPEDQIRRIKEDLIRLIQPLTDAAINFDDLASSTKKAAKEGGKDFSDFVQNLRTDLQSLQGQESGDPFAKIKESTADLTNAFIKLKNDGKLTAQDIIDAPTLIDQIEQAKTDILSTKLFEDAQATSAKKSAENWAAVYKAGLANALKDVVPAVPQLDDAGYLKSMTTMLAGIEQAVVASTGRTKQQLDSFATGVTAIVQQMAGDLVGGLAEGIGNALSGVKNPFGSLLKVLGDGLVTLGKFVIQSYITLEALKKLLASAGIQPAVGIAIGAAMVALGTVIRNKVNQTRLAEGGVVSGPISTAIGEAGQSEVVMPLSRLSSIMRGNNGGGQVVFQISGQNLVGVLNRGTASLNRTFR